MKLDRKLCTNEDERWFGEARLQKKETKYTHMKMRTDLNLWPTIAYYAMERLTQAKTKKSI